MIRRLKVCPRPLCFTARVSEDGIQHSWINPSKSKHRSVIIFDSDGIDAMRHTLVMKYFNCKVVINQLWIENLRDKSY